MSVSNTPFSSNDPDHVDTSSSSPDPTGQPISLWNWPLADDHRYSPLATSFADSDYDRLVQDISDESTALIRSIARRHRRNRNSASASPAHSLRPTEPTGGHFTGMLSAPPTIINFLEMEPVSQSSQPSRVVIVDHERGIQSNQNLFFDFFGGGDSSEAILEYYRRQILNAMTVENPIFRSRDVGYVRNE